MFLKSNLVSSLFVSRARRGLSSSTNAVRMKISKAFIECIKPHSDYVFGVIGKSNCPILESVQDYPDMQYIASRHEGGGGYMAYGYAQSTGKLGVCTATSGGGATNLLTGVAAAYHNSVPMLAITGQVPSSQFGKGAIQEGNGEGRTVNITTAFKSSTKYSTTITNPNLAVDTFMKAIQIAMTGRPGPVHIDIPIDVQLQEASISPRSMSSKNLTLLSKVSADKNSIEKAVELITEASSPVFLMGYGCVFSGGCEELIKIAEQYQIPIVTTLSGKGGIHTNHPLSLGALGISGNETAKKYMIEKADLIIAVGTSFSEFGTFSWLPQLMEGKKLIHIDIDPNELGKVYSVDVGIIGDSKVVLQQVANQLTSTAPMRVKKYVSSISPNVKWDPSKIFEYSKMFDMSSPIKPQRLMYELRENTPDNTIFVTDTGNNWSWAQHYLPIYNEGGYYSMQNFASMGTGICSAIGVQLGHPKKPVVCVCGDGGFQMHGNEIAVASQYGIPVVWVILNDARWGMPYQGVKKLFGRAEHCLLPRVDFAKISEIHGVKGYTVNKPGEAAEAIKEALRSGKPAVIDANINPDEVSPGVTLRATLDFKPKQDSKSPEAASPPSETSVIPRTPVVSPSESTSFKKRPQLQSLPEEEYRLGASRGFSSGTLETVGASSSRRLGEKSLFESSVSFFSKARDRSSSHVEFLEPGIMNPLLVPTHGHYLG